MKPLFIIRHAHLRIRQRGIALSEVKAAIREPDLKGTSVHGRLKVFKRFGRGELVVIYAPTKRLNVLITAYWRD